MKTGPRLSLQSRPLNKPKSSDISIDVDRSQDTTTRRSRQRKILIQRHRTVITPSKSPQSAVAKGSGTPAASPSGSIVYHAKGLDVEIAHTLFHSKSMRCVKFSRDGKYIAAGCEDGKAYIYDVQEGTLTW
jgi:hypothetical protein